MVYTIISKLPFITSDKSDKRFFKIFVFGSLIYLLVHYYLFQKDQDGILNSIKTYLYYAMALDFCLAYSLDQWIGHTEKTQDNILPNNEKQKQEKKKEEEKEQEKENEHQKEHDQKQLTKYTPEQLAEYERKFFEWNKQQQFMKEKDQCTKHKKYDNIDENHDFQKEEDELSLQKKIKKIEKSENSKKSSQSDQCVQEDTDIPIFVKTKNT